MNSITARDFIRNFATMFPLPEEGLEVTHQKYGSFYVTANPQATPSKTEIPPLENSEITEEDVANVVGNDDGGAALGTIPQKKFDYCRTPFYGHPKGQMYQLTTIQFDDPNGNVLYKGGACPGCIAQYKEQMKKEGTLYIEGERQ